MADIINPFMQSIGQMFSSRTQHEHEKEMKITEDTIKGREEFKNSVGVERYGDMTDLWALVADIRSYINNQNNQRLPVDQAKILYELLQKLKVVEDDEPLHPYEIPALFHYKVLMLELHDMIK